MSKLFKGQRVPITNEVGPNTVLDGGKYHLSYNGSSIDYGSDTTALVLEGTVFFILNGDHRDAFAEAKVTGGLQACFDYFLEQLAAANPKSEHHNVLEGNNTFGIAENALRILGEENIDRLKLAAEELKRSVDQSEIDLDL